jgi:putative restriction endonuclease
VLSANDLCYQVLSTIQLVTRDVALLEGSNPFVVRVNGLDVAILVKNINSAARLNEDECRIQVSDSPELRERAMAYPLVFLGYDEDTDTFTAWDPASQSPRVGLERQTQNVSLYTRWSVLQEARRGGVAVYTDGAGQRVISFQSDLLTPYLQNRSVLHGAENAAGLLLALDERASESEGDTVSVVRDAVTVTLTRTGYPRDPRFRRNVLEADEGTCVACGMQMGLVEAAHIVPHAHPQAPGGVENGICLCPLHHAAFDAGLLVLDEDFTFRLNPERVAYFEAKEESGGMDRLREAEGMRLARAANMPTVEIVRLARRARGL